MTTIVRRFLGVNGLPRTPAEKGGVDALRLHIHRAFGTGRAAWTRLVFYGGACALVRLGVPVDLVYLVLTFQWQRP